MPIWLMHSFIAHNLGVQKIENDDNRNAFFLGNFSPDWINFIPDGRSLYRRSSHFISDSEPRRLELEKLMEIYEGAKSSTEQNFYKGYALHVITDSIWARQLFMKYLHIFGDRPNYYKECFRWDNWILDGELGGKSLDILQHADQLFKNISGVGGEVITPEGLEAVKAQALIFYKEARSTDENPIIFSEAEVLGAMDESIEIYREHFKD